MSKKRLGLGSIILGILAVAAFFVLAPQQNAHAAKKTVTFGATGTSFPTSFKKNDKLTGFDVDVANTAAKRLGYKTKWVTADFDGLFGSIDNGKIDSVANDVAITKQRSDKYLFTSVYSYDATAVAVQKGSKFKNLKDLEGHKVAAVMGSNNIDALKKYDKKIIIKTYESRDQAYSALNSGHVSGMVNTRPILEATIKEKGLDWKVVKGSAKVNKIALPFKDDAHGKKLQKQFTKEINKMRKDGTLTKISKKYYGYDTTKE
jgi:putative amino-acid transport system substrate-binding protein